MLKMDHGPGPTKSSRGIAVKASSSRGEETLARSSILRAYSRRRAARSVIVILVAALDRIERFADEEGDLHEILGRGDVVARPVDHQLDAIGHGDDLCGGFPFQRLCGLAAQALDGGL